MLKDIVSAYANGIIEVSKSEKTEHLKPFTDEPLIKKLLIWVQSWHSNDLFMDAKIDAIAFDAVKAQKETAQVFTTERWRYRYINTKEKKVVFPPTSVVYTMKYTLAVKEGKWLITAIETLSEKQSPLKKKPVR